MAECAISRERESHGLHLRCRTSLLSGCSWYLQEWAFSTLVSPTLPSIPPNALGNQPSVAPGHDEQDQGYPRPGTQNLLGNWEERPGREEGPGMLQKQKQTSEIQSSCCDTS